MVEHLLSATTSLEIALDFVPEFLSRNDEGMIP